MSPPALALDPARTTVTLRTSTTGLFSPLAHDLELACEGATGQAEAGEPPKAQLQFPVESIRVVGAIKHGQVDPKVLSEGDRREIERRIREHVLTVRAIEVKAEVSGGTARLEIKGPKGTAHVSAPITVEDGQDGAKIASGKCKLTLPALGVGPVKGPMGVFRVADEIAVEFRAAFRLAPGASHSAGSPGAWAPTSGIAWPREQGPCFW